MMPDVTARAAPAEIAVEMLFPGGVDKDISQKNLYYASENSQILITDKIRNWLETG